MTRWTVYRGPEELDTFEVDWGRGNEDDRIPGIPRLKVGRANENTELSSGNRVWKEGQSPIIIPSLDEIAAARSYFESQAAGKDPLLSALARGYLENEGELWRAIFTARGWPHPWAWLAPEGWDRARATDAMVQASDRWTSRCSCAVIRTAPRGYQCWRGMGSHMEHLGHAEDISAAEALCLEGALAARASELALVRERDLPGWPDRTPYYAATLGTARDALPLQIRRGPMSADDHDAGTRGSSRDLPIVAEWQAGAWTRWPERVTWSDDVSRANQRVRERGGQDRRAVEIARALELLSRVPAVAALAEPRGLRLGSRLQLLSGEEVQVLGPVRLREDGAEGQALVKLGRGKMWLALARFAR